jgi:hypothetical protein
MHGDALDFHSLLGAGLLVHVQRLELVQDVFAFEHLAEDGVLPIEVGCGRKGDEELAAVRVGAFVGHAHNPPRIVAQGGADLVLEQVVDGVVDGGGGLGLGVGGGRAGLHHEAGDHAVEGAAVVEARGAQGEEVFGRLGHRFAEDLELDITARGVELRAGSAGRPRPEGGVEGELRMHMRQAAGARGSARGRGCGCGRGRGHLR